MGCGVGHLLLQHAHNTIISWRSVLLGLEIGPTLYCTTCHAQWHRPYVFASGDLSRGPRKLEREMAGCCGRRLRRRDCSTHTHGGSDEMNGQSRRMHKKCVGWKNDDNSPNDGESCWRDVCVCVCVCVCVRERERERDGQAAPMIPWCNFPTMAIRILFTQTKGPPLLLLCSSCA